MRGNDIFVLARNVNMVFFYICTKVTTDTPCERDAFMQSCIISEQNLRPSSGSNLASRSFHRLYFTKEYWQQSVYHIAYPFEISREYLNSLRRD